VHVALTDFFNGLVMVVQAIVKATPWNSASRSIAARSHSPENKGVEACHYHDMLTV
jgi:hypothetical protein